MKTNSVSMLVNQDKGYRGMRMNKVKGTPRMYGSVTKDHTNITKVNAHICCLYSDSYMLIFYVARIKLLLTPFVVYSHIHVHL